MHLFLLLEPYVLLNHLAVQAYGIHAVTLCPEVIAPVRFLLQNGNAVKIRIAVRPFRTPISPDTDSFGGMLTRR